MTELVKKKEELKKKIRSLLLSAPLGLTQEELVRDYHSFIGERLPTRELGYSSVEELLHDLPDVVQITVNKGVRILKAISDASTQNIEKLVSRQKLDGKKRRTVLSGRTGGHAASKGRGKRLPGLFASPWANLDVKESPTSQACPARRSPVSHARHQNLPVVSAYVRSQINELVKKHPSGIPLTHVSNIFYKSYGLHLDYQGMGFSSEYDLFASLADIVTLRKFSFGEVRVMSVESASALAGCHGRQVQLPIINKKLETDAQSVSREICQTSTRPTSREICPTDTRPASREICQTDTQSASRGICQTDTQAASREICQTAAQPTSKVCQTDTRPASRNICQLDTQSTAKNICHTDTQPTSRDIWDRHAPGTQSVQKSLHADFDIPSSAQNSQNVIDVDFQCDIPMPVQDNIRQIMLQRPNGIYASRLPIEYKSMFEKDLPYKTYGYNSVIEFAAELTHIVRIERPHPQGDWHLLPANGQLSTECRAKTMARQQSQESEDVKLEIDQSTQEAVSQVLTMNPDGVVLERFESIFKVMTGQTLDYARHGARDLKQFLQAVPHVLVSSNALGKSVVCQKVTAGPRRFDRLQGQYQPTTALEDQVDNTVLRLPSDAVSPGCCYTPQPLPDESVKFIDLYVAYVVTPGNFYIQLRGRNTTLALEDLTDEMEKVYNSKNLARDYHMTTSLAKPGMICAAIFPEDGNWYRGIIKEVKDQLFEVYYIDYGNTCSVSITSLRLLKTKFLKFPAQAIRARLSNIKPKDGVWRENSKNRLLELCRDTPLVGLVTNIKDGVISLCLTDTTNEDYDIHINDVFVSEGYADVTRDVDETEVINHDKVHSGEVLFGENACSAGSDSSPPASDNHIYIRQVQMTDDILMNLINLDGQLYIWSSEISLLFFTEDVLSAQLCKDNVDIPKVVVTRRNHPGLFNELALYDVPNFNTTTNVLSLFPLSELPLIVDLYGKDSQFDEVKATTLEILKWFNPDDPYWRGEDDACGAESSGLDTCSVVSDGSDLPGYEDLQLVLNTLAIKRKRILQQMLTGNKCSASSVNDLNDVEWNIVKVKALITKLQGVLGTAADGQSCATGGLADSGTCLPSEDSCDMRLPTAQLKSTQRVAPLVQATSVEPAALASTARTPDLTKLLEERIMLNTLLLEQIRTSQEASNLQGLTGELSLAGGGQGMNKQEQKLTQQHLQLGVQKEKPTSTVVTHSIVDPLLSLGKPTTSSQQASPLATSTPTPGTVADPLVSPTFLSNVGRKLPLDSHSSLSQEFISFPTPHLVCLQQNLSPGKDGSLPSSQQSTHVPQQSCPVSTVTQQSHPLSHMPLVPDTISHTPQQFPNLDGRMALDFNFSNLNSLSSLYGSTNFNIPAGLPHNIQYQQPSWYTAPSAAVSMAPSQVIFPPLSQNFSVGLAPTGSILLPLNFPQQPAPGVDLMPLMPLLLGRTKDVNVFTANSKPGSGF